MMASVAVEALESAEAPELARERELGSDSYQKWRCLMLPHKQPRRAIGKSTANVARCHRVLERNAIQQAFSYFDAKPQQNVVRN
jgi:hypothetical protein